MPITAVIFDMDGVLLDSGGAWNEVLQELFLVCKRPWSALDQQAFAGGDNSRQWASYLRRVHDLPLTTDEIIRWVTERLLDRLRVELPLLPGAVEAVARIGAKYKLGLASSSPRQIIAYVLNKSGLESHFAAWVSSDDVSRGKPAPDVYLRTCELLAISPASAVAVEDSPMGVTSAKAAGLGVIAIPHPWFPPARDVPAVADLVLTSLDQLLPETVARLGPGATRA